MKGIELSEKLFFDFFLPAVREGCPEALPHFAAGLVGRGSECFSFDDDLSQDHDFFDGFYIWLNNENDIKYGVKLHRIYKEITEKHGTKPKSQGLGFCPRGVVTIEEFFMNFIGSRRLPKTSEEWFSLPSYALAEATNGKIFYDGNGEFSATQNELKNMPEEVRLKKISAALANAAQSGQYNFERTIRHGEMAAAAFSLHEFVQNATEIIFLLNRQYMPYYKWAIKGLKNLDILNEEAENLEFLITAETSAETHLKKVAAIEKTAQKIASCLSAAGLSSTDSPLLDEQAFSVRKRIQDDYLLSLHIMEKE